jgi:hypothetical protein
MKSAFALVSILTLISVSAFAFPQDVLCGDRSLTSKSVSLSFIELDADDARVEVIAPYGEPTGRSYTGMCAHEIGTDELSVTCNVRISFEEGWEIKLFSDGTSKLQASITVWNIAGAMPPVFVPCDNK